MNELLAVAPEFQWLWWFVFGGAVLAWLVVWVVDARQRVALIWGAVVGLILATALILATPASVEASESSAVSRVKATAMVEAGMAEREGGWEIVGMSSFPASQPGPVDYRFMVEHPVWGVSTVTVLEDGSVEFGSMFVPEIREAIFRAKEEVR